MEKLYLFPYILLLGSLLCASTTAGWETLGQNGSVQVLKEPTETVDGFLNAKVRVRRGYKSEERRKKGDGERQEQAGSVAGAWFGNRKFSAVVVQQQAGPVAGAWGNRKFSTVVQQQAGSVRKPWADRKSGTVTPSSLSEHLNFAQQYSPTLCFETRVKEPHRFCSPKDEWGIHGLRTNKVESPAYVYCDDSKQLQSRDLETYRDTLNKKWTNVFADESDKDPYYFWKHQWRKHGTCAASYKRLNSYKKYFQEAFALFDKYQMSEIFKRQRRGQGYNPVDYARDVSKVFQAQGRLTCYQYKNKQYIREVEICLTTDTLEIINCPLDPTRNCDDRKELQVPIWKELRQELGITVRGGSPKSRDA